LKELYTASLRRPRDTFTPLVGAWWGTWLVGLLFALLSTVAASHRESGESQEQFTIDWLIWHLLPTPLFLVSGTLLLILILKIDLAQSRLTITQLLQPPAPTHSPASRT